MGNSNNYLSQRSRGRADTMSSQFSSFKMKDDSTWGYTRDQGEWTEMPALIHALYRVQVSSGLRKTVILPEPLFTGIVALLVRPS